MPAIFCFTSTGNSLYTAQKLAEKIGGKVMPMNNGRIETEDDVIGFIFPSYFWGLPRMVERFTAQLNIGNKNAYIFAVVTCGGRGFGELGRLKLILASKGVNLKYGARLISVSNYIPEYLPKDTPVLRQKVNERIEEIAAAINARKANRFMAFTLLNKIIYKLLPAENSDQHFTIAPSCTGCEICQKVCPAKNIIMEDGRPCFQHRCEHCLACLHNCPEQAIDWKGKTEGKNRYRNAGVSLNDLILFTRVDE